MCVYHISQLSYHRHIRPLSALEKDKTGNGLPNFELNNGVCPWLSRQVSELGTDLQRRNMGRVSCMSQKFSLRFDVSCEKCMVNVNNGKVFGVLRSCRCYWRPGRNFVISDGGLMSFIVTQAFALYHLSRNHGPCFARHGDCGFLSQQNKDTAQQCLLKSPGGYDGPFDPQPNKIQSLKRLLD